MARGNWQRRVERTEIRRKEEKLRKQKTHDKRLWKGWVQTLLAQLDRHGDAILHHHRVQSAQQHPHKNNNIVLHVWTDASLPAAADNSFVVDHDELIVVDDNESPKKKGGRPRATSFESSHHQSHEGKPNKGRHRSGSFGSNNNNEKGNKKKVHPRSKEAAAATAEDQEEDLHQVLLCQAHFFGGKCDAAPESSSSRGKKGGCRYEHYVPPFVTMYHAMNMPQHPTNTATPVVVIGGASSSSSKNHNSGHPGEERNNDLKRAQVAAAEAMPEDIMDSDPDAMEMVYYHPINLSKSTNNTKSVDEGNQTQSLSEQVTTEFSNQHILLPSVVYVTLNNVLIFDRHREGVLLSDQDFCVSVAGQEGGSANRPVSMGRMNENESASTDEATRRRMIHLPGTILEYILTYLPDAAVAAACQVCNGWYREIGKTSNLWRFLLERRDWPLPTAPAKEVPNTIVDDDDDDDDNDDHGSATSVTLDRDVYRNQFLDHYGVLRDARALETAVAAMMIRQPCEEKEMVFQDFSKRKHAPTLGTSSAFIHDGCVSLQDWSPNHVLAAYGNDCTLRLFEAAPVAGSSEKRCKELVCQSVDPYRKTKKRVCTLEAMDHDETFIACLCYVSTPASNNSINPYQQKKTHILVILTRNDFLLGTSSDAAAKGGVSHASNLNVVDIGEAVLNFVVISDVVDPRLLPLVDFLEDGDGELGPVEIKVSPWNLVACGDGILVVEVSISIPVEDDDDDDAEDDQDDAEPARRLHLDRKLVLFSAKTGTVVGMRESYSLTRPVPSHEMDMVFGSSSIRRRQPLPGESSRRSGCTIVVSPNHSSDIMVYEIAPPGNILQTPQFLEAWVRDDILANGQWEIYGRRHVAVTSSDVVATDNLRYRADEAGNKRKAIVSFYPRKTDVTDIVAEEGRALEPPPDDVATILFLKGALLVRHAVCVRDQYLVAMCTTTEFDEDVEQEEDNNNNNNEGEGAVPRDWQWLGERVESHLVVVIHVPSRRELGRVSMSGTRGWGDFMPTLSSSVSGNTLGLAFGTKGVVLTGDDVRSVGGRGREGPMLDNNIDAEHSNKSVKKKKKAKGKRSTKKDAYFRGQRVCN